MIIYISLCFLIMVCILFAASKFNTLGTEEEKSIGKKIERANLIVNLIAGIVTLYVVFDYNSKSFLKVYGYARPFNLNGVVTTILTSAGAYCFLAWLGYREKNTRVGVVKFIGSLIIGVLSVFWIFFGLANPRPNSDLSIFFVFIFQLIGIGFISLISYAGR